MIGRAVNAESMAPASSRLMGGYLEKTRIRFLLVQPGAVCGSVKGPCRLVEVKAVGASRLSDLG